MLEIIPLSTSIAFIIISILTLLLFRNIISKSNGFSQLANPITFGIVIWMVFQMIVSYSGFYTVNLDQLPPRFLLAFFPILIVIVVIFFTKKGKTFIDSLPLKEMTLLHTIRIPVEIVLYLLFTCKAIPELMTFSGRNFDIIAGITAPFIIYFAYYRSIIARNGQLIWNFAMLGLLLFIIANGLLSAPTALQQFAFDQPNLALLYFPMVWLPALVVPAALFCHFASIRQLIINK